MCFSNSQPCIDHGWKSSTEYCIADYYVNDEVQSGGKDI
jgi:hypothetical protein